MSDLYKNNTLSPEIRARALLEELSLEEKFAQLQCTWIIGGYEEAMKQGMKHGIGHYSSLFMRLNDTPKGCATLQKSFQEIAMETGEHHIPAITHMEGLCGAYVQGATCFPSPIGRASTFNPASEEVMGQIIGRQERAVGITQTFAPVLDISRDSRLGRQGETYGEDPTLAAAMGSAMTRGLQKDDGSGKRTDAVAKHFLGFHTSFGGIHGSNTEIGERLLLEVYGKPFQAAIKESQLRGIMPCYNSINGEAASGSHKIMTQMLCDEMEFDGMVVSDYNAVHNIYEVQHVAQTPEEAGEIAIQAGMDVELPMVLSYTDELLKKFKDGSLDVSILDRAALRVLTGKFRMGLFDNPYACEEDLSQALSTKEDEELSYQMARESMVLLKNDGTLPVSKNKKKVALIGYHAKNARSYFGGYTHLTMSEGALAARSSMAGVMGTGEEAKAQMRMYPGTMVEIDEGEKFEQVLKTLYPDCKNLYEELTNRMKEWEIIYAYGYPCCGDDTSYFEEALQAVREADIVLLTLGGKHGTSSISTMGEGVDATDIGLPKCQEDFIRLAAAEGKPMVGIHFNGRPISSNIADEKLNAILEAWSPAKYGAAAIVDIITGKISPSGKMPLSVAYNAGQIPVYYNHPYGAQNHQGMSVGFPEYMDCPHTPRYPFGYGLSYTSFEYSGLEISSQEVGPLDTIHVSFTLKNIGAVEGTEVVQLYLSDQYGSMVRPVQELVGFSRVHLVPGESAKVSFEVEPSLIAFLDSHMKWKIEKGLVDLKIGSSSTDVRLASTITITEDAWIKGPDRKFYTLGKIIK